MLENGNFYDFHAEKVGVMDVGGVFEYDVPRKYQPVVEFKAGLWKEQDFSSDTWSDKVVNPIGYIMKGRMESVSCES